MSEAVGPPGLTSEMLNVSHLSVTFRRRRRPPLVAVDDVSFAVGGNETVGLVGESGSGKTTIARTVLGMARTAGGSVTFEGEDITHAGHSRRRELSQNLQVVFQDPYGSLSPTRTIGQTLIEPLLAHRLMSRTDARARSLEMLARVGLDTAAVTKFPREFSGGQRQRIAIARALILYPKLVILDEPVSALDLSVQAQVLNLLRELQKELGLSYLFIAHNLPVVKYMSHRILVLYRGRLMESGDASAVYRNPGHPYTRMLLSAAPLADPAAQAARRSAIASVGASGGPSPAAGCPFAPRCPHAIEVCTREQPPVRAGPGGTDVACFRAADLVPAVGHDKPGAPANSAGQAPKRPASEV